jgi:hypothetical protein
LTATGSNPRSAQLHNSAWPTSTAHVTHGLLGLPRPAWPVTMRRGAAGGGATIAEVEQRKALEHPQQRGHPSGMWVEAIAHQSFLPTGRGENRIDGGVLRRGEGSDGQRWSCVGVEGGEEARLNSPRRKSGKGGARGSAHREGFHDGGGGRTAAVARSAGARRSDGDLVGFRHGRWRSWDGACEMRRGEAASAARWRFWTRPVENGRSGRLLTRLARSDIATHGSQSGRGVRRHCH